MWTTKTFLGPAAVAGLALIFACVGPEAVPAHRPYESGKPPRLNDAWNQRQPAPGPAPAIPKPPKASTPAVPGGGPIAQGKKDPFAELDEAVGRDETVEQMEGARGGVKDRFSLAKPGVLLTMVSEEEERELGLGVAARVAAGGLSGDERLNRYVSLVGAVVAERSSRPGLPCRFAVLESAEVNAMACPGGYIFVTRGLIDRCADEAELAAVLAHELVHVVERHGLKALDQNRDRIRMKLATKSMDEAIEKYYGPQDPELLAVIREMEALADDCWLQLSGGRSQPFEYEADAMALGYLAFAGYDPRALKTLLARLQSGEAEAKARPFSTHPATADRLARLDRWLEPYAEGGARNAQRYARAVGR